MQSLQEAFVLELNVLEFSPAVDLVETFVDFGPEIFGFGRGIGSLPDHDTRNLLHKELVFSLNLDIPHLFDHFVLAAIEDYRLSLLPELGVHGFNLFEIHGVVGVLDLLLFLFDEAVGEGFGSVHCCLANKFISLICSN